MQEMQFVSVDFSSELWKRIEPGFLGAPVVHLAAGPGQRPRVINKDALGPAGAVYLVGPPDGVESPIQAIELER